MSLLTDLTTLQEDEEKITDNKVANFAYTDTAYTRNEADGVPSYDPDAEQNIPVGTASVLKVNSTVLFKGWRSQASSLTRMLLNHFLGRTSYNLNKINDHFARLLTILENSLGEANGIATLGSNGRMPYSQLPEGAMTFEGEWDADTNSPELSDDSVGNIKGKYYNVSVAGTQDLGSGSVTYLVGDSVIFDGEKWKKISGGSVRTVNNVSPDTDGNVSLTGENIHVSSTDATFLSRCNIRNMFQYLLGRYWKVFNPSTNGNPSKIVGNKNCLLLLTQTSKLYRSTDRGETWELLPQQFTYTVYNLAEDHGVFIVVSGSKVYRSLDGLNFEESTSPSFSAIGFNDNISYIDGVWYIPCTATSSREGLLYSEDDGLTFTYASGFSSEVTSGSIIVGKIYKFRDTLFSMSYFDASTSYYAIFTSSDSGETWTKSEASVTALSNCLNKLAITDNQIWIVKRDGDLVYTQNFSVYATADMTFISEKKIDEIESIVNFAGVLYVSGYSEADSKSYIIAYPTTFLAPTSANSFRVVSEGGYLSIVSGIFFARLTSKQRVSNDCSSWMYATASGDTSNNIVLNFDSATSVPVFIDGSIYSIQNNYIVRSDVETLVEKGWLKLSD